MAGRETGVGTANTLARRQRLATRRPLGNLHCALATDAHTNPVEKKIHPRVVVVVDIIKNAKLYTYVPITVLGI